MEPGQAGRRWNKKHFCSSPFPSPGRPPRRPRRASPARAPALCGAAHDPGPPSSARRATTAAAGRGGARPVARRAGPEVSAGPRAARPRPRPDPSWGRSQKTPHRGRRRVSPSSSPGQAAPRLPCTSAHDPGAGWAKPGLGIRKLLAPGPATQLPCSPPPICKMGRIPALLHRERVAFPSRQPP